MSKELHKKLAKIQKELVAKKGQRNSFGNYNYRSCEDVLEALKPHLGDLTVTITDEIVMLGERVYVKATASINDGEASISATSFAREADSQKGMSPSQLTGATSSYARKYALNGLFLIDDNKDADTDESKGGKPDAPSKPTSSKKSFRKPKNKAPETTVGDDDDI